MRKNVIIASIYAFVLLFGSMNWISCSKKISAIVAPSESEVAQAPTPPANPTPPNKTDAPTAPTAPTSPTGQQAPAPPPGAPQGEPPFIAAIREQIKGKEDLPAEQVFENIQVMKGITAGQVIPIMMEGFNKNLGVRCNHCHARGSWSSDENPKKQIAREMWKMTYTINHEIFPTIKNLENGEKAFVSCGTCHRGKAIPVIEMAAAGH